MKRALGAVAALLLVGCGDNSKTCGDGTDDSDGDGMCEAEVPDDDAVCGDGTKIDPITMDCVPDASACSGGTVLVHNRCQDPTAGIDIDLEEGPEPNAFEPGAVPAGLVTLEAVGSDGFVIRGCIKPIDDMTPDFDVYLLEVTKPTLIKVTADGVLGLAAGFQMTSPTLAGWLRLGVGVATDMSRRQILLPTAGTYRLIMSDSRSLFPIVFGSGGPPPAAGNPDGTSCYYVTIDQQTPVPTALTPAGDMTTIGEDLKFYSTSGLAASTRIITTITSVRAAPALVVLKNDDLFAFDNDGDMTFNGTGNPTIVGDFVYNYALFTLPYRLQVQ